MNQQVQVKHTFDSPDHQVQSEQIFFPSTSQPVLPDSILYNVLKNRSVSLQLIKQDDYPPTPTSYCFDRTDPNNPQGRTGIPILEIPTRKNRAHPL